MRRLLALFVTFSRNKWTNKAIRDFATHFGLNVLQIRQDSVVLVHCGLSGKKYLKLWKLEEAEKFGDDPGEIFYARELRNKREDATGACSRQLHSPGSRKGLHNSRQFTLDPPHQRRTNRPPIPATDH